MKEVFDSAVNAHVSAKRGLKGTPPADIIQAAKVLAALGPQGAHELRVANMEMLSELAAASVVSDAQLLQQAPHTVKGVLKHAGDSGPHLAFLNQALRISGYSQREALMHSLVNGFQIVGLIPVEESSKPRLITDYETTQEQLHHNKSLKWESLIANVRKVAERDPQTAQEILNQTLEDQRKCRISEFRIIDKDSIPATKRFGIKQLSSTGKEKN